MTTDVLRVVKRAPSHSHCILCSEENRSSLGLKFCIQKDGSVIASFVCRSELQGYRGILHGGVTASLLDAAMTHCLFNRGIEAVTADLHIRYLEPIECSSTVRVVARVMSFRKSLFRLRSEIWHGEKIMARAEACFLAPKNGLSDVGAINGESVDRQSSAS